MAEYCIVLHKMKDVTFVVNSTVSKPNQLKLQQQSTSLYTCNHGISSTERAL